MQVTSVLETHRRLFETQNLEGRVSALELAYRMGPNATPASQPTRFDRPGKIISTPGGPGPDSGLTLSPDRTPPHWN